MTRDSQKVADWHEGIAPVRAVYARHRAGCCLHIVTDDGNVEQSDAEYCLAAAREAGHADCLAAAELLVRMSSTQRGKLYRAYDEYAPSLVLGDVVLVRRWDAQPQGEPADDDAPPITGVINGVWP